MKRYRVDVPKATPGDLQSLLLGEPLSGQLRLDPHLCQRLGIEVTLVQREVALADDGCRDARLDTQPSYRTHAAVPLGDVAYL